MKINHFKIQNQNFGMSFVKIFSRYRIFSRKNFVGSVVFGYQAPGIYNGNLYPQEFAQKSNGIITRVEIGYSFKDSNANLQIYNTASDFLTFAFEYKRNIGLNYAETIFDFTFGHFLQNDILLLLKLQKISYIVNNVNNVVSRNNNLFDPFANNGIFKVGFSFVMNVSKNINIEAGYFHSIAASFLHTSFKPLNLNSIFVGIWLHD